MPGPMSHRPAAPVAPARRSVAAGVGLAVTVLIGVSCSNDPDQPTTADLLNELEGRTLTAEELAQRNDIAVILCGLDDAVLVAVWDDMSQEQLGFQDIVFTRQCPSRADLYRATTGRIPPDDG